MVLTNGRETVTFGEDGVKLDKLRFFPHAVKNNTASTWKMVGELCVDSKIGTGRVEISGYIGKDAPHETKRKIMRICATPFELIDGDRRLSLVPECGVETSAERRFSDKLLYFKICALTLYPLWQSSQLRRETFYSRGGVSNDETAIRITNRGDVSVGMRIRVLFMTSVSKAMLSLNGESILVIGSFSLGNELIIDTRRGKKTVELISNQGETPVNYMHCVVPGSSFFELEPGENRIDFTMSGGSTVITIELTEAYLG